MYLAVLFGCNKVIPRIFTGTKKNIKNYFINEMEIDLVKITDDDLYEISEIDHKHAGSYVVSLDKKGIEQKFGVCSCIPLKLSIFKISGKVIDVDKDIIGKLIIL